MNALNPSNKAPAECPICWKPNPSGAFCKECAEDLELEAIHRNHFDFDPECTLCQAEGCQR